MTNRQDTKTAIIQAVPTNTRTCPECHRTFDLWDENEAEEWYYGHDCEEN